MINDWSMKEIALCLMRRASRCEPTMHKVRTRVVSWGREEPAYHRKLVA